MGVVIYSSYYPDEINLFRGIDFLNQMLENFKDYIICIGIQINTCQKWVDTIEEYIKKGLKIKYGFCDEQLYVNSDVSGYQKAIKIFYDNYKNLELSNSCVWFGHSKGVTTNEIEYHNYVMKNFWSKKKKHEIRLLSDERKGCFGNHLSFIPDYSEKKVCEIWKTYSKFKQLKKPLNYMFVNTFFIIKYDLFKIMIDNIEDSFFNEKIKGINGVGDRYFFERDFIHFVDIMGFEPDFDEYSSNIHWYANKTDYIENLKQWKKI
jgi:hypothetical protein